MIAMALLGSFAWASELLPFVRRRPYGSLVRTTIEASKVDRSKRKMTVRTYLFIDWRFIFAAITLMPFVGGLAKDFVSGLRTMWTCKHCGYENENNLHECWNCGTGINRVPPPDALEPVSVSPEDTTTSPNKAAPLSSESWRVL